MKRTTVSLALIAAMFALTACEGSLLGLRGSGNVVSETRDVSGFDRVELRGSGTVSIEIGGTESLTLEAEDNLMEYLTTDVEGTTLVLEASRSISPTEEIVYTITATSIEGLSISGSGDITAGDITGAGLDAEVSGSGSILVDGVNVGDVAVDIGGSGRVDLSGATGNLDLTISGSGEFEGEDLVAETGDVSVSGSGEAVVHVTDHLQADISGSGDITYFGNPSIESNTSGSGSIRPGSN